jgi:replication factor C subunit 2/4
MLKRLMTVCSAEGVDCSDDGGLEAVIFTAEGDMRQALNNLQASVAVIIAPPPFHHTLMPSQSTFRGYGTVTAEHVFKVCDQVIIYSLQATHFKLFFVFSRVLSATP